MFGFSAADWIFIAGVMIVIFACIGISDMRKK
jgi:Sec-independent protein translocase protein TatA